MIIHTTLPSDTIYSISKEYGVPESRIVEDNTLDPSLPLLPGQALLISKPTRTCTVRGGESLRDIAARNHVSELSLLQNNPILLEKGIRPSQTLNVSFEKCESRPLIVDAYTESADPNVFRKYLPSLSMLTLRGAAAVSAEKVTLTQSAKEYIRTCREYRVRPIVSLPAFFDEDPAHCESRLQSLVDTAAENGFAGIEIECFPADEVARNRCAELLEILQPLAAERALCTVAAIYPTAAWDETDERIFDAADLVALQSYIWDDADTRSPASPQDKLIETVDHSISKKFKKKLLLGIPTFGIDYTEGDKRTMDAADGSLLCANRRIQAKRGEKSETPYISYSENNRRDGIPHTAHFEDAHSYLAKLELAESYRLGGICIYSLSYRSPILWQVLNQKHTIWKQ